MATEKTYRLVTMGDLDQVERNGLTLDQALDLGKRMIADFVLECFPLKAHVLLRYGGIDPELTISFDAGYGFTSAIKIIPMH